MDDGAWRFMQVAGSVEAVCQHLDALCRKGKVLSKELLLQVLQRCIKTKQLSLTRCLHALVVKFKQDKIPIVADHLIRMFSECGSLHEANLVFRRVDEPNVHTWNAIIAAHIALGESDNVFHIFDYMLHEGTKPDKFIYMNVFKLCGDTKDLVKGRSVHKQLVDSNFIMDRIMGGTLVNMYAKCGSTDLACKVFNSMPSPDKVAWNSMIGAYVHNGNGASALELFDQMQLSNIGSDRVTFLTALKACTLVKSLDRGKAIHEDILNSGLGTDVVIGSTLIDMYSKCGSMDEAQRVFDDLPNRNVVSWGAIIAGYAHHGHGLAALLMFEKMQHEGIKPDAVILACVLKACGAIPSIVHGNMVYGLVIKNNLESDVVVVNNLFYMYSKAGSVKEARKVFDQLSNRDVISWATMIAGYALNGQGIPALDLFKEMQQQGIYPDKVTYSCILKACGITGASGEAELIHEKCSKDDEFDLILANTLIDMYGKCGNLKAAHKLFNALPIRDVVSWNSLITAYGQDGQGNVVFEFFEEMQREGIKATIVTFLGALRACVNIVDLEYAKKIHRQLLDNDLASDMAISNALINTYSKCGRLDLAHELFGTLKSRDPVSWGAMIGGYVHNGENHAAFQLFKETHHEDVKPDNITIVSVIKVCSKIGALKQGQYLHNFAKESGAVYDVLVGNALMNMYAKSGHVDKVFELFKEIPARDIISWKIMISALTGHGHTRQALKLFEDMPRSILPDEITLSCALKACSFFAFVEQDRCLFDNIIKNKIGLSLDLGNTALDMHIKCEKLREAWSLFDSFSACDVVAWGVIIGGYAHHGFLGLAKQCLKDIMRPWHKPASPKHLSIMAESSQVGFADEGYAWFIPRDRVYGTMPGIKHFNTLVDHLGWAGKLYEAEELLQTVPSIPSTAAWVSLLTACKAYGNKGIGQCCFIKHFAC